MLMTYIALGIFALAFLLIVFDAYDKALIALFGALMMVITRVLTPEEAIEAIHFETLFLLMGMMILVNIASKSGVFEWLNVKIAALTKGNPLAIFFFFSLITGVMSAFLDNVTTVLLIIPLTIELVRGMGKDPRPYIFAEMFFANIGGSLTLIGDASNIIIGGYAGLTFLEFIQNLWIPITLSAIFTLTMFVIINWKQVKPISNNLVQLCIANIIIKSIKKNFVKKTIHKDFVIKVVAMLILTITFFLIESVIHLPNYVIAFTAAIFLGLLTYKRIEIHETLESVEWTTLFFFAGLFILVGGVEKTGVLEQLSDYIANSTSNMLYLSLIVLWTTGIASMIIDNVPFVTVMVPVIAGVQANLGGTDTSILWWALSLGACLGGGATLIGASANVVSTGIARKHGVNITFLNYLKFSLPITIGILTICSFYLFFRLT